MMDPEGFAAAFRDRRDARVGLELGRRGPAGAVGTEGGREARRADRPGAGETWPHSVGNTAMISTGL